MARAGQMNGKAKAVLDAALALPTKKRAAIAERLLRSLDGPEPTPAQQAEVDAAWAKEIERRTREVDAGRMELIPAEQVFAEVEEVIRKVRAARKKRKV